MSFFHAIALGLLQGLTELFPVSSLGHSVLVPHLLGWAFDESSNSFLVFLVATHLATSLVLLGFYFRTWVDIVRGMGKSLRDRSIESGGPYARLGWLLVVATVPAGILGILFEDKLKTLFASPVPVATFLFLNGVLLVVMERMRRRRAIAASQEASAQAMQRLTFKQAVGVGFAQSLALLPGFSRTGSSLGGSLLAGLDHVNAAEFSFLLATPIIFAAAILKIPDLFTAYNPSELGYTIVGAVAAALAAYVSVRYLSVYFKTKTLTPFGVYCIVAGGLALLYFVR